jgi:hypothetical protein
MGALKHNEMVESIDAGVPVEKLSPVSPHDRLRILTVELQTLGLHLAAEQPGELQGGAGAAAPRRFDC